MKRTTDITVEILKDIRGELRKMSGAIDQTNARLDQTNVRLDALREETNERIDSLREELGRRIVESEFRTATALTDLAGSVREMTGVLRTQGELRPRVEKCENDIAELKRRLPEAS